MNSKLRDILRDAINEYGTQVAFITKRFITGEYDEAERDRLWLIEAEKLEALAEKAIRQAVGEELLDIVGPDIYTERPSGGSNSWKAQDELRAELRQKIKSWAALKETTNE